MSKIRPALLLLFPLLVSCSTTIKKADRSALPAAVSEERYEEFHRGLFTADGNSRGFTASGKLRFPAHQHDAARDFIFSSFESMGYETRLDPFHFSYFNIIYTNCNNVIAVKPGTEGTRIHIIGAHYDTVDAGHEPVTLCPGADDNGSGVAALLEAARVIAPHRFKDTIIFIAFDGEEKGLFGPGHSGSPGAHHFVSTYLSDDAPEKYRYARKNVDSMICLDTIAYTDIHATQKVVIGRRGILKQKVGADFARAVETYTDLQPSRLYGYGLSDHVPFDQAGIESIHIIEAHFKDWWPGRGEPFTENPYYHSDQDSTDQPGYINYSYAARITQALVGYLCEQAVALE